MAPAARSADGAVQSIPAQEGLGTWDGPSTFMITRTIIKMIPIEAGAPAADHDELLRELMTLPMPPIDVPKYLALDAHVNSRAGHPSPSVR